MRTRRFTALLCVFCMLFTSIPSSVMSDTLSPVPENTSPAAEEQQAAAETEEPNTEESTAEETVIEESNTENPTGEESNTEEPNAEGSAAAEAETEEPAAEGTETEEPNTEKPEADLELVLKEDQTINGTLEGECYRIRVSTCGGETLKLNLILESESELEAIAQDEQTGKKQKLVPHKEEDGRSVLLLEKYKVGPDGTWLITISGSRPADFSLRLVKSSLAQAAEEQELLEEGSDESPEDEPEETPAENQEMVPDEPEEETPAESAVNPGEASDEEAEPETTQDNQEAGEAARPEESGTTQEQQEPGPGTPEEPEEPETPEKTGEQETPEKPEATDESEAPEEPEAPDIPKPEADEEITAGEDTTVSGELNGEYLIRFTPAENLTLFLILTAEGKAETAVTDEETGITKQFVPEESTEEGRSSLSMPFYKVKENNTYLIRLSGTGAYSLRLVSRGVLKAEQDSETDQEEPTEKTAETTDKQPDEEPDEENAAEAGLTGETENSLTDELSETTEEEKPAELIPLDKKETELVDVEILSFSAETPVSLTAADNPEVVEGLEVLGTFTIEDNIATDQRSEDQEDLYIKAELKEDAELDPMEGVALYSVDENGNTDILMEQLTENAKITELDAAQIAVVKDTGYRHLTLTVNPDETTEDQMVTLDGMMPKDVEAVVEDVTEQFADYIIDTDTAEAEPEADAAAESGHPEQTDENEETSEDEPAGTRTTLAAYEISINHSEGEYQPDADKPISVEIVDSRINAERSIELWHIRDDGTEEQVTNFELSEGRIVFEATGFSVYVVIDHDDGTVVNPRVEFHFITDFDPEPEAVTVNGEVQYYIGGRYSFKNKTPEIQYTQILSDGESLELINDPGNKTEKYFYGWYIVDAHPVDGATDENGIGTTDPSKIYYSWPSAPVSVTFESPISIQESRVNIGDWVSWTINGVSGTGKVDSDGNVHVLLAPVFEKYNFVNFMLYPREDSGTEASKKLMNRKMIALGSSSIVEVKISDIRSASTDPVHLIFTGWEYLEDAEWAYRQTVNYTGAEMEDPGKDGVYLEVDLADTTSIDLYPKFVQARWVDYFSGVTGSGATYVASKFRESWGFDPSNPPEGMADNINPDRNVFTNLTVPTRAGYRFGGWYAFAVTDPTTGEITNLNDAGSISISYLDNDYHSHTTTDSKTAVQISNASGDIIYNGQQTVSVDGQAYYLFTGDGSQLKLFDGLDRLTLYARWIPDDTEITIVYWTENAEDDNYIASATKTISTADLTGVLPGTYTSGSIITLETLKAYDDVIRNEHPDEMLVDHMILDDVGAVPKKENPDALEAREEIFYDLNETLTGSKNTYQTVDDEGETIDNPGKMIDGQGTTSFNVYYSRKIFKLVFHIGHDGYVKNSGQQRANGDNWLEYMYNDPAVTALLGHAGPNAYSYEPQNEGELAWMKYDGRTYDSSYVTDSDNIQYNYVPTASENDQNLYIITAKYGAYIEDLWPSPVNGNFEFNTLTAHPVNKPAENKEKSVYIWTANYHSLYHVLSFNREIPSGGDSSGSNADINGMYEYMSAELCADRTGNDIINEQQVHHLVAYFGEANKDGIYKKYHFLYEQVDGVALPEHHQLYSGDEFLTYLQTTWSGANTNGEGVGVILDKTYYEDTDRSPVPVISNLAPQYQLGTEIDGYRMVFSCYDEQRRPDNSTPVKREYHVYFFYTPKEYKLTFMFESGMVEEYHLYKQSLAGAAREAPEKEGYYFDGWYTNEAGEGERFDFATETMPNDGLVLYPVYRVLQYDVKIDPNGGVIDHINYDVEDKYHNKANDFLVDGTGYNTSQSTYFTANYGTTVGEYTIKREYIKLSEKELDVNETGIYIPPEERYYYINTQLDGIYDGDWGLPPNLRNAVYMTEEQLHCYYNFYVAVTTANLPYYTNVYIFPTFEAFAAHYTSYPNTPYRRLKEAEHYSFMGWYQVTDEGVASMPFNFNEPVTENLVLRAQWRLDGGYYLQYNPIFIGEEDGDPVPVTGQIDQWTDPKVPSQQLYADRAPTHILRAPDKVSDHWVFRGWRVVKKTGEATVIVDDHELTYDVWEPIQKDGNGEPIYYQPGDNFIIDSNYISETTVLGSVIHMQAYYELDSQSVRRPEKANLTLDADGGFITNNQADELNQNISLDQLGENGTAVIDAAADQIIFGNIQSNIAVHLAQYAVHSQYQYLYDVPLKNYFKHQDAYFLLGFDEDHDTDHIAKYPADSVIAVQRTDKKTLYAVWERMVYVNFINTTDEDITLDLTGTGNSTVSIVNVATGLFDREKTTSHIVVPAKANGENGRVKIVLPGATPGLDKFTATATNDHLRKKMSVYGELRGAAYENLNTTSNTDVKYGGSVIYEQTLVDDTNGEGIFVYYTEIPVDEVVYDVNKGTWQQELSENGYEHQMDDIYVLTKDAIDADPSHSYHPTDPTRADMIFVGWTEYKDIADHTDFHSLNAVTWGDVTIIPDEGSNVLKKIKDSFLWDFDHNPPPYDKTLYAVWSETATATFKLTQSGNTNHRWEGPETTNEQNKNYVFYRASASSNTVTYTLMKGEILPRPSDPTNNNWYFLDWVTVASFINKTSGRSVVSQYLYDFDTPLNNDIILYTSWTNKTNCQIYTFTVNNIVEDPLDENEEFTYTITAEDVNLYNGSSKTPPAVSFPPVTVRLKNGESYSIRLTTIKEKDNDKHNYDAYDVYAEVIDNRDGSIVGQGHLLNYRKADQNIVNEGRQYTYKIHVKQTPVTGYSTNVYRDENSTPDLTLGDDELIFLSSLGSQYTPNTNPFTGNVNTSVAVTFVNRRQTFLTLTKDIQVNLGDWERDFVFTLDAVEDERAGTEYAYTTMKNGRQSGSGRLTTGTIFRLKKGESIRIDLPRNKAVTISEDNTGYETEWSTSSSTLTLVPDSNDDAKAAFTLTGNADAIVTNTGETKTITVTKIVDGDDQSGEFNFTATIANGSTPVAGFDVYTDLTTDANGQVTFTLGHNGNQQLTIPCGTTLVVAEETLLLYTTSAAMVGENDNAITDDDGEENDNSFTVNSVSEGGTITFTNTPREMPTVTFDVNGGTWVGPSTETSDYSNEDGTDLYVIPADKIPDNPFPPDDPTYNGKMFIGWTINEDIAKQANNDYSGSGQVTYGNETFNTGTDQIALDVIKENYLWDFSQDPPYGQTLYAVWSDTVTVTFDISYQNGALHEWGGPLTSSEDLPYVFYRSGDDSNIITYSLAKGEKVPRPDDPAPNEAKETSWGFITWVYQGSATNGYNYTPKDPGLEAFLTQTFDFNQRIMEDVNLITSWSENLPHYYVFTIQNQVVNGRPGEEFDYTIAVTNELIWGKKKSGASNDLYTPGEEQKWGEVTTKLKNDEIYTVTVKVSCMTNPWKAYSVEIDVVDRDGTKIKSGHVITVPGNGRPHFSSDFYYTLLITQTLKDGYETTTGPGPEDPVGTIESPGYTNNSFSFTTKEWTSNNTKCNNNFKPEQNEYLNEGNNNTISDKDNRLTIVFKNTGTVVELAAPTGFTSNHTPYILLLVFGLFLMMILGGSGAVRRIKKRNTAARAEPAAAAAAPEADATTSAEMPVPAAMPAVSMTGMYDEDVPARRQRRSENRVEYKPAQAAQEIIFERVDSWGSIQPLCPRTAVQTFVQPPCPRMNLWTQPNGTSGKRGGSE